MLDLYLFDSIIFYIALRPPGGLGAGKMGYLFAGSWEALLIILGELGSKHILLGIQGALPKSKTYQASIYFIL